MFTIDQIKEAHAKVKSGSDFPDYVQELIKLGVANYDTYIKDGLTEYIATNGYTIQSGDKYASKDIAAKSNSEQFKRYLEIHQQGQTGYPAFCKHLG